MTAHNFKLNVAQSESNRIDPRIPNTTPAFMRFWYVCMEFPEILLLRKVLAEAMTGAAKVGYTRFPDWSTAQMLAVRLRETEQLMERTHRYAFPSWRPHERLFSIPFTETQLQVLEKFLEHMVDANVDNTSDSRAYDVIDYFHTRVCDTLDYAQARIKWDASANAGFAPPTQSIPFLYTKVAA